MEKQYDNTNRGILFTNHKKTSEKSPDYTGQININGVDHFLSAWNKRSKAGNVFLSLSIGKVKDSNPSAEQQGIDVNDIGF